MLMLMTMLTQGCDNVQSQGIEYIAADHLCPIDPIFLNQCRNILLKYQRSAVSVQL